MALLWSCFSRSMSFLCWGPQELDSASGAAFLALCRTPPALICVSLSCCMSSVMGSAPEPRLVGPVMMPFPAVRANTHHNSFILSLSPWPGSAWPLAAGCMKTIKWSVCLSCWCVLWLLGKAQCFELTVFQMQCLPSQQSQCLPWWECLLHQSPVCAVSGWFLWCIYTCKGRFPPALVNITALLLFLCWPICAPFSLVLTHVHRVVRTV